MEKNRKKQGGEKSNASPVIGILIVIMMLVASFAVVYYAVRLNNEKGGETPQAKIITVFDDFGRTVKVRENATRLITFGPSATEVVFSLGLGSHVVAVDDFSDYPAEAAGKEKIGAFNINFEKVAALKPDVIIAADIIPKQGLAKLQEDGYSVIVLSPKTVFGVLQDIRLVGLVTGANDEAGNVTSALQKRINAVTTKTQNASLYYPRVYLEYYPMFTYGPNSIGNELLLLAGGRNIAANTTIAYPMLSSEFVIVADPEIVVYTTGLYTNTTAEKIKTRPGWGTISAVKSVKIYSIDDNIMVRPGPRTVDALESLAEMFHPGLFK
jgi:iron complex transport system substrate-binding protein